MTTLADRIRKRAASLAYDLCESESERRAERKEIARELRCSAAAVRDALKRSSKLGKPRNPALTRCEKCGQALPTQPEAP